MKSGDSRIVFLGAEAEAKQHGNACCIILRYRRRHIDVIEIDDQSRCQGDIVGGLVLK